MENKINIKELRRRKGWTQTEMGEAFGVVLSTVWRWENEGIPTRGLARKVIEREWQAAGMDKESA